MTLLFLQMLRPVLGLILTCAINILIPGATVITNHYSMTTVLPTGDCGITVAPFIIMGATCPLDHEQGHVYQMYQSPRDYLATEILSFVWATIGTLTQMPIDTYMNAPFEAEATRLGRSHP